VIAMLEVKLADNQALYGFDAVALKHTEAEFLFALRQPAPNTVTYDALCRAIWGKYPPAGWLRQLASTAAALRVKLAPWGFAILCHSRIGYRLIHEPVHAGVRSWRRDEELLLRKLVAEGMRASDMVAYLPRHDAQAIRQKLVRLRRSEAKADPSCRPLGTGPDRIRSHEKDLLTEKAA
jgi:hypothetical protein